MSAPKLSFGFNLAKKATNTTAKPVPSVPKPLLSDEDSEDREEDEAVEEAEFHSGQGGRSKPKVTSKFGQGITHYADSSAQRAALELKKKAEELDPSIFDYDAAYDAVHARDAAKKAAAKKAAEESKSRYIDGLMQSAETRKQNQLRAREKMLQREREAEGDTYADKEKFVTEAYKKQQEEVRRLEEAEKKREEEEMNRRKTMGAQAFYKHVMEEREKVFQEATEATKQAEKEGVPVFEEENEKSERQLAEEAIAKGLDVILNDEGQIADRRQLLSAGLNIVAKPKQDTQSAAVSKAPPQQTTYQGRNAGQRAMHERQTRMLEAQLEQAAKRAADEEMEEQRKLEHAAKSRKTDVEISSARERYLQRKREAEAAKAAGKLL